jgi:uncharacterized protein with HEPN domain
MEIRNSARLAHILEAARDVKNFIQGKDRAPGLRALFTQSGDVFRLAILLEAPYCLTLELVAFARPYI